MLITTGRNPDAISRAIAQALGAAIPRSIVEGRGRRTLSGIISKARKKRFPRVCTIYKVEGKPCAISFLSVDEKGWKRLSPQLQITSAKAFAKAGREQSSCLEISGTKASALKQLLSVMENEEGDEPESKITAGASKITIHVHGKRLIELGVKYEG
ncbi:Uncharacterised protein [uncultured archaeon]|nr:Uncharacterised protein [uncultured archaeon]